MHILVCPRTSNQRLSGFHRILPHWLLIGISLPKNHEYLKTSQPYFQWRRGLRASNNGFPLILIEPYFSLASSAISVNSVSSGVFVQMGKQIAEWPVGRPANRASNAHPIIRITAEVCDH